MHLHNDTKYRDVFVLGSLLETFNCSNEDGAKVRLQDALTVNLPKNRRQGLNFKPFNDDTFKLQSTWFVFHFQAASFASFS